MTKKKYNKRSMAEVKDVVNPMFLGMTAATMSLIGGAAKLGGAGLMAGKTLSQQNKIETAQNQREYNREQAEISSRTSSGGQTFSQEGGTLIANEYREGGFTSTGAEPSGELQEFNTGGSHEENPIGGIPVGMGANGKPNTVEEGETATSINGEKFYFSARTPFPKGTGVMPGFVNGDSFAEASKSIDKAFKDKQDKYSNDTKKELYERLSQLQIVTTQQINENNPSYAADGNINQNQMAQGGYKTAYEAYTRAINPDWASAKASGFTDGTAESNAKLLEYINSGYGEKELNEEYSKLNKGLSPSAESVFGMKPLMDLPEGYSPKDYTVPLDPSLQGTSPLRLDEPGGVANLADQQFNDLGIPVKHAPSPMPGVKGTGTATVTPTANGTPQRREEIVINPLTPRTIEQGSNWLLGGADNVEANMPSGTGELIGMDSKVNIPTPEYKKRLFGGNADTGMQGDMLAGLGFLTQGVGIASNIIAANSLSAPETVEAYTVGNKEYEPFLVNRQDILREINNSTTTATKAMAENSGGDFGSFAANAAAVNDSGNKAISGAMLNANAADSQELARVQQMEAGDEKFNSQVQTSADIATAQNKAAYDTQKASYNMGIAANVGSMGQSLMNYGIAKESGEAMGQAATFNSLAQLNKGRRGRYNPYG